MLGLLPIVVSSWSIDEYMVLDKEKSIVKMRVLSWRRTSMGWRRRRSREV